MTILRTIKLSIASLLLASASAWSSDTAVTQVWLHVEPVYRLKLPDSIILQNTSSTQQFDQVCVGITGVTSTGNTNYSIQITSANFGNGSHRLHDGSANYINYDLYWDQQSNHAADNSTVLSGLTMSVTNAAQNFADIQNDVNCTTPVALLFDLNDSDLGTATGSYSDTLTITLSGA